MGVISLGTMQGVRAGSRFSRSLFTWGTRNCQRSAIEKLPFAHQAKNSAQEKSGILQAKVLLGIGFLAFLGVSVRAYSDPWGIERKLINYRPERYVKERENFTA